MSNKSNYEIKVHRMDVCQNFFQSALWAFLRSFSNGFFFGQLDDDDDDDDIFNSGTVGCSRDR